MFTFKVEYLSYLLVGFIVFYFLFLHGSSAPKKEAPKPPEEAPSKEVTEEQILDLPEEEIAQLLPVEVGPPVPPNQGPEWTPYQPPSDFAGLENIGEPLANHPMTLPSA